MLPFGKGDHFMKFWKAPHAALQTTIHLFKLFRHYSLLTLLLYIVLLLFTGAMSFAVSIWQGRIVWYLQTNVAVTACLLFMLQMILTTLIGFFSSYVGDVLTKNVNTGLQIDLVNGILTAAQKDTSKGQLLSSFHMDTSTVINLGRQILSFISNLVIALAGVIGLLVFQPKFLALGLVGSVLICWFNYNLNIKIGEYTMKKYHQQAQYVDTLNNIASAYEELKLLGAQPTIYQDLQAQQAEMIHTSLSCDLHIESPGRVLDLLTGIIPALGYFVGVLVFAWQPTRLAQVVTTTSFLANFLGKSAFLSYILVLCPPLAQALQRIARYQSSKGERDKILSAPPCAIEQIECRHISFSYDGVRPVLQDLHFTIPSHGLIWVNGVSGAGKSTLLKLLALQLVPDSGDIFVNGLPLRDLDPTLWCKAGGCLQQNGFLLSGTVRENLQLFAPDPDLKWIQCLAAELGLIGELGEGYLDIPLDEDGTGISVGQKDRLRLLCLLSRHPRYLLLDEPTASLDVENAKKEYALLYKLSRSIPIVCASHDPFIKEFADMEYHVS